MKGTIVIKKISSALTRLFNDVMLGILITVFIFSPVSVMAAEKERVKPEAAMKALQTISSQVIGAYSANQMEMANIARANMMAQKVQSLRPQEIQALPYFPQCIMPKARSNFSDDLCKQPITNQYDRSGVQMIISTAKEYEGFYTNHLSEAQTTPVPKGLQCLKDSAKKARDQLQDKLNHIENLISQINKEDQLYKEELDAMKKNMDSLYAELNGGGKTLSDKTRDFGQIFNDAACKEVLTAQVTESANTSGLLGIRKSMTTATGDSSKGLIDLANNMSANANIYKKELDTQIKKITDRINKYGVSTLDSSAATFSSKNLASGGMTQFKAIDKALIEKYTDFSQRKKDITTYLQDKMGFTLPTTDGKFQENIKKFATEGERFFRNRIIADCINGGVSGVALTKNEVLKLITQKSSNQKQSQTAKNFAKEIERILNLDADIYYKMDEIKKVQDRFKGDGLTISYDARGGRVTQTPYEYYKTTMSRCEKEFESDKTFSQNSPNAQSYKDIVATAKSYIDEIASLEKNFAADLRNSIIDEAINCGQRDANAKGSCSEKSLSPAADDFCLKTSLTCAANVQNCYAKVDNFVKDREAKIIAQAKNYNQKVYDLITKKQQFLKSEGMKAIMDVSQFGAFFKQTKFEMPKNFFVSMPELQLNNELGIKLRGGGNNGAIFDSEGSLIAQLEKLKEMFTLQSEKIFGTLAQGEGDIDQRSVVGRYIAERQKAWEMDKARWENVQALCQERINEYQQNLQRQQAEQMKAQQEGMKKYAEDQKKVKAFCKRFGALGRVNPMGGCKDVETLTTTAGEIADYLNPEVSSALEDYSLMCANNQMETDAYKDSEKDFLIQICQEQGNSSGVISVLREKITTTFSLGDQKLADKIEKCLSNQDDFNDCKDKDVKKALGKITPSLNVYFKLKKDSRTFKTSFCADIILKQATCIQRYKDSDEPKNMKENINTCRNSLDALSEAQELKNQSNTLQTLFKNIDKLSFSRFGEQTAAIDCEKSFDSANRDNMDPILRESMQADEKFYKVLGQ